MLCLIFLFALCASLHAGYWQTPPLALRSSELIYDILVLAPPLRKEGCFFAYRADLLGMCDIITPPNSFPPNAVLDGKTKDLPPKTPSQTFPLAQSRTLPKSPPSYDSKCARAALVVIFFFARLFRSSLCYLCQQFPPLIDLNSPQLTSLLRTCNSLPTSKELCLFFTFLTRTRNSEVPCPIFLQEPNNRFRRVQCLLTRKIGGSPLLVWVQIFGQGLPLLRGGHPLLAAFKRRTGPKRSRFPLLSLKHSHRPPPRCRASLEVPQLDLPHRPLSQQLKVEPSGTTRVVGGSPS